MRRISRYFLGGGPPTPAGLRLFALVATLLLWHMAVPGAEPAVAGNISRAELQALERAIARELNKPELGSQTLGDLQRLKFRLENIKQQASGLSPERVVALEPLEAVDAGNATLRKLQNEATPDNRSAQRALAFYQLFSGQPESALAMWRKMGPAHPGDVAHQLFSAYLELTMGEYTPAQTHLEEASRLMRTRTSLELSTPFFCTNIAGYRLFEKRGPKEILPGEDTLIYVEIEGADFHNLPNGDSECRLMFGLSLRNESGVVFWSEPNYGEYAPLFNGPIRDLHTALAWRVPNDLAPGLYRLTVQAVEDSSKRRGESVMEFNVSRRATNPEAKIGAKLPPDLQKTLQDAGKAFPGAANPFEQGERLLRRDDRTFDLLRQYEQNQRVDRR